MKIIDNTPKNFIPKFNKMKEGAIFKYPVSSTGGYNFYLFSRDQDKKTCVNLLTGSFVCSTAFDENKVIEVEAELNIIKEL